MTFKSIGLSMAALGLAIAPVTAQATVADRSAPVAESSELGGGDATPTLIILAIGAIGITLLAVLGDDDDDDDIPVSV
ncbi:hypothetical protein PF049_11055 [Erythrobacteraceae bacterium WH01K]|nr:hypothetical protein PF049_11055 [Erythrobacteraceae bacterium WH01K]